MSDWQTQLIVGLVIAIATSLVTVRLSLSRFRSERWWERKADSYASIVGALHDAARWYEMTAKVKNGGIEWADEFRLPVESRFSDAQNTLAASTAAGTLLMSKDAARILRELHDRPGPDPDEFPGDYFSEAAAHYRRASAAFIQVAKADLSIK